MQIQTATRPWPRRRVWTLIVLGAAIALTAAAASAQPTVTDLEVARAVEDALWADEVTDANAVDVACEDGVVTLSGTVDNLLAHDRAEEIAESTVGVRAIVNLLEVRPALERTDDEIEQAVAGTLLANPATDSWEVEVSVDDGVAVLTGQVQSWQEKQLCGDVTRSVGGVTGVVNQIDVVHTADRTDREIAAEVEARLANDVRVDSYLVVVDVENGRVRLSGTVGSLAEKNRVIRDAWVAGVEAVDGSALEIEWWARDEMRRRAEFLERSDDRVRNAVKDAFLYDPRVLGFDLEVVASDGTVTLSGVVDNLAAKRAAEEDARNVVGVWRVINHIKVRPTAPTLDDALENRVAAAFRRDPLLERTEIDISANLSLVTLSGTVDTLTEKRQAEAVAEQVNGVVAVVNNLDYDREWVRRPDHEIRADIEDELWWSPFVDADEVEVAVTNGVATLTGTVETWAESHAAEENALEGGALDVRNQLEITHEAYGPFPSYEDTLYPFGW